jgi:DNA invertase Pin-like site-specific DNA recombinase
MSQSPESLDSRAVFLYVRVSTLDQVGGAESQTRALTDWCAKNSHNALVIPGA